MAKHRRRRCWGREMKGWEEKGRWDIGGDTEEGERALNLEEVGTSEEYLLWK